MLLTILKQQKNSRLNDTFPTAQQPAKVLNRFNQLRPNYVIYNIHFSKLTNKFYFKQQETFLKLDGRASIRATLGPQQENSKCYLLRKVVEAHLPLGPLRSAVLRLVKHGLVGLTVCMRSWFCMSIHIKNRIHIPIYVHKYI